MSSSWHQAIVAVSVGNQKCWPIAKRKRLVVQLPRQRRKSTVEVPGFVARHTWRKTGRANLEQRQQRRQQRARVATSQTETSASNPTLPTATTGAESSVPSQTACPRLLADLKLELRRLSQRLQRLQRRSALRQRERRGLRRGVARQAQRGRASERVHSARPGPRSASSSFLSPSSPALSREPFGSVPPVLLVVVRLCLDDPSPPLDL
eukprot:2977303-Rhodomonas_salina.1